MTYFWRLHVLPRMKRLKQNLRGEFEDEDLSDWGSNSFRRSWDTLAHKNDLPIDLIERQGRWRTKQRRRNRVSQRMTSLYCDPFPEELLRATRDLGTGPAASNAALKAQT